MSIFTASHALMAILYYIVFLLLFLNSRNLGIRSSKIFHAIIHITNVTLILNVLTSFIFYRTDHTISTIEVLLVRIYIIVLVWGIYMHLCYIKNLCERWTTHCIKIDLPLQIIATIIMAFGSLSWIYVKGSSTIGETVNIIGTTVVTAYTVSAIQIVFGIINVRLVWKHLDKKEKFSLRLGCIIWLICLSTQLIFDVYLDMLCTVFVMTMFIYFHTFENTSMITDTDTDLFNRNAFSKYLNEQMRYNKNLYIINVYFSGISYVRSQFGDDEADRILSRAGNIIERLSNNPAFIINHSNLICITEYDKKDVLIDKLKLSLRDDFTVQNTNIQSELHLLTMDAAHLNHADEVNDLIDYIIEECGKNLYSETVINIGSEIIEKQRRVQTIISIIQNAIINDGFNILYQPIYNTKTHTFSSAEALIRIKDTETLGFISPEEFIPIAEKYGLISQIGYIVFNKVCEFAKTEQLNCKGVDYIEINLSALQSIDTKLPRQLIDIMYVYQIDPSFINLEVTETATVNSEKQLVENMTTLKEAGCTFSMDDFGTGYSNLSQIASMGYDIIKLDKSLLWPCFGDYSNGKSKVILKNIITMILELGIHIVAEGVETKEQADLLTSLGVHYLQGYYYSRPISQGDYIKYIEINNK